MAMTEDTRMNMMSEDVTEERITALRDLFPEAFTEGKVDFGKLKQALKDFTDERPERYGLSWAGKSEAFRAVQTQSAGTLIPIRDESVNFDTTEHIFIEGDNLEVLKLLQKSYHGQVKMIYIDPPYNTGKEFIYPDNFHEGLQDYLRYSGQVDGEGIRLTTNTETSGRYHSKWLSMMYPRLFLAKNLLADDGVIFVSIDDHEVDDLRMLMNEIFGEEGYLGTLVWQSKKGGGSDATTVVSDHEYVVSFCKAESARSLSRITLEAEPLDKVDEKGQYRRGRELNKWGSNSRREDRPTMWFPITGPDGEPVHPIRNDGTEGCWRWGKKKMFSIVERGDVEFVKRADGTYIVHEKIRSTDPRLKPYRTWLTNVGTTADGSKSLKELFDGKKVYDFPKPLALIKHLISLGTTGESDIVLDFFAGSCTTAHAIMEMNQVEGERQFICVQIPEPTSEGSEARKAGYATLTEVGKERIRRVIKRMNGHEFGSLELGETGDQDRGVKVFSLTASNFKLWNTDEAPKDADKLAEQIALYADHLIPGRTQEDVLYELLLKAGLPLTAKIQEREVAGQKVFSVAEGMLLICLEEKITAETLRGMMALEPQMALCLDNAFAGNDQLKANIVLEMRSHDIKFHTV